LIKKDTITTLKEIMNAEVNKIRKGICKLPEREEIYRRFSQEPYF